MATAASDTDQGVYLVGDVHGSRAAWQNEHRSDARVLSLETPGAAEISTVDSRVENWPTGESPCLVGSECEAHEGISAVFAELLPAIRQVNERTSSHLGASGADCESDDDFERLWESFTASSRLTGPGQLSVGSSSSSSSPYLSYYDILLTNEDVKSLKSDWLTDNNIAFWEEWLEREILPQYPQARICLLRPTMTFMMMRAVDLSAIVDALPNFKNVTHIFLPINDNHDTTQGEGGTHWSLLLVSVIDGIAFHYDSLHGSNWSEAQSCTRKLQQILNHQLKMNVNIRLLQLNDCPQQENMNDCGVFVCIIMRHLLIKRLLNANANEKVSMSMKDKRIDSYGGRKEMLRIIESLRKEGERRRSASPFATSRTPPRIE